MNEQVIKAALDRFRDPIGARDAAIAELSGQLKSSIRLIEDFMAGRITLGRAQEEIQRIKDRNPDLFSEEARDG